MHKELESEKNTLLDVQWSVLGFRSAGTGCESGKMKQIRQRTDPDSNESADQDPGRPNCLPIKEKNKKFLCLKSSVGLEASPRA